jgi:hypothetical protein
MIIQIPEEIKKEIKWTTLEELEQIINTTFAKSNYVVYAWAIYSKAELLFSLSYPASTGEAFQLYEHLASMPNLPNLPVSILKQAGMVGMARCYSKGWPNQHANDVAAYQVYETLLKMTNLSDEIKNLALFGKAKYLMTLPNHSANCSAAYQCYETLLGMSNLSDQDKQRATFGKAQCLQIGWRNHPADLGAVNQLSGPLLKRPHLLDEIKQKIQPLMTVGNATPATAQSVAPSSQQVNVTLYQANQSTDQDLRQTCLDLKKEVSQLKDTVNHLENEIALLRQQNSSASTGNSILTSTTPSTQMAHQLVNNNTFFQQPRPATRTPQNNKNPTSATAEGVEYRRENSENSLRTLSFMAAAKRKPTVGQDKTSEKRPKK